MAQDQHDIRLLIESSANFPGQAAEPLQSRCVRLILVGNERPPQFEEDELGHVLDCTLTAGFHQRASPCAGPSATFTPFAGCFERGSIMPRMDLQSGTIALVLLCVVLAVIVVRSGLRSIRSARKMTFYHPRSPKEVPS